MKNEPADKPTKEWHECWNKADAICPYCGSEQIDMCEVRSLRHDGDATELECDECERSFKVSICVSITYTTEPIGGWSELEPKP